MTSSGYHTKVEGQRELTRIFLSAKLDLPERPRLALTPRRAHDYPRPMLFHSFRLNGGWAGAFWFYYCAANLRWRLS